MCLGTDVSGAGDSMILGSAIPASLPSYFLQVPGRQPSGGARECRHFEGLQGSKRLPFKSALGPSISLGGLRSVNKNTDTACHYQ